MESQESENIISKRRVCTVELSNLKQCNVEVVLNVYARYEICLRPQFASLDILHRVKIGYNQSTIDGLVTNLL